GLPDQQCLPGHILLFHAEEEHKEKCCPKKNASNKLMKDLDENGDNEVDFNEFVTLVAALTCFGYKRFEKVSSKL
uniref:EF-hand domain-containing protein n=1 Tax=Leptobrachium leishanense TaxID=445787 RepID=A0A8C5M0R3_9ANUR